jgi:hypothetical protein
LGYIEFDDLCNLDCLEERIFAHADLPLLPRHSYHVIGKYNNKGQYLVHHIYICTNLNSPFVVQDCDRLEGNHRTTTFPCPSRSFVLNKTIDFQEGEHHWFLPSIPALSFLGNNLLQDSVAKHFVSSAHDAYMLAKFSMQDDIFTNWKHGDIPPHNNFNFLCFRNPVLSCVVQDRFQVQSNNHAYVHAWCMDWRRWSPARFSKSRKRSKVDPSSPRGGGQKPFKFGSSSESRSSAQ